MAKKSAKKSTRIEKSQKKKKEQRTNPFELKFNRAKHQVLGKKTNNKTGVPGASRKKADDARKATLFNEYKTFGKVNVVVDKRVGERDPNLTSEEKLAKRFALERQRAFIKRGQKFRLEEPQDDSDDGEQLTHRGETLAEIEKHDRPLSEDEEEGTNGNISADIVARSHFGGGPSYMNATDNKAQTRKDMIAELIAKTKQQRYDKQMQRDEQLDMTDKLDEQWKQLVAEGGLGDVIAGRQKNEESTAQETKATEGYDTLVRQLQVDSRRVRASERLKTPEELAKEERDRLQVLEKERLKRMGADGSMAHRSADDDDENMERFEKSDFVVKYGPDGLLLNSEKVEKPTVRVVRIDNESSDEDEEYEEDEDEEGEDDDEDEDGEEDDDGEASELSGDDDVDGHQDDDDEDEEPFEEIIKAPSEKRAKKATAAAPEKKKDKKSLEGGKLAKAGNSLPFVFDMPKSYEAFKELLHNRPAAEVALITERLIKCHHPSLKEGNKQRLARLFMFALRYFDETAANKESVDVAKLDSLTKTLYALLRFNPDDGAKCVRALLKRFRTLAVKKRRRIPGFNVVAFLRLVPTLFPASDVWHPVVTPCFIVATHILSNAHIISPRDAAIGLLLCSTLVEYVCDGKRYLPEVIAFLRGVLLTAIDHKEEERSPTGTFPISQPHRTMLLIKQKTKQVDVQPVSLSEVVTSPKSDNSEVSEQFKLSIIRCTVGLVQKFAQIYSQTTAYGAIFRPFEQLLSRLPVENYPEALAEDVGDLRKTLNAELSIRSRLLQLQRQKTQKPMVKMLEPRFEENFDPERPRLNRDANRKGKKAEDKRMVHKYKKELRGTVRELRRDNQFLAREQRKEAMSRDSDRRAKTKNLMKSLMGQEADYKQLNKKKKFK